MVRLPSFSSSSFLINLDFVAMAEWTEQKSATITDYVMGQYVTANSKGIRTHPYSTSATTNPLRYSSVKTLNEVHSKHSHLIAL